MASKYWTGGANNGDFSDTNNWSATANGASGAGAPVNGSDVFILETAQDITVGLAQTAVTLTSLTISFAGTIGTASSSLVIGVSGTTIINSTGSMINLSGGTAPIALCKVRGTGSGIFRASGGTITEIQLGQSGNCSIDPSCVVTVLRGCGCPCYAGYNATAFTTVDWQSGNFVTDRAVTTLSAYGPSSTAMVRKSAAVTTANIFGGATLIYQSNGTLATLNVGSNSRATASGSINPVTITNSTVYGNGYIFANEIVPVTFTNATSKIGLN